MTKLNTFPLQQNNLKVTVIGAGTMGSGIAQWFVQQQVPVDLIDRDLNFTQKAQDKIFHSWDNLVLKGKYRQEEVAQFKNILQVKSQEAIDPNSQLVIEAIFEDINLKKNLFTELDQVLSPQSILASNTSSFSMASLAKELSPARKKRFLGLHFFNPAPLMKLVEIIAGPWTEKELLHDLFVWFEQKDKAPVFCLDRPGFIVNRVARNFYGEALRIAQSEESKTLLEIDEVLKKVGGFKMGPFELMDLIGIDINLQVTKSVWEAFFWEPRFAPHALQQQMVDSGRLGRKTKEGFYRYE